ncbi:MAG: GNAT family N-acetyltransferase [Oscillospiraceae bacterium]|nr:GNAT family N-acetyltransferase [Oscillospiraceae bacterium]
MRYKILDETGKESYREQILKMLSESDGEFVPPLSKRSSTTQKNFSGNTATVNGDGVETYAGEMLRQKVLVCVEEDKIIGLVSFKEDYTNECIGNDDLPNIYISTLLVSSSARGMGVTKKMYSHLFFELYSDRSVYTRTWSTNTAHIKILEGFGFEELSRIENDRGKGIDTVYFSRSAN